MRQDVRGTIITLWFLMISAVSVHADSEITYHGYDQFARNYDESRFKSVFGPILQMGLQGLLLYMAIIFFTGVIAMAIQIGKLGSVSSPAERAAARKGILVQTAVFALLGVTPAVIGLIASVILGGEF